MRDYKSEIIASRVGALGGSDANIIARTAQSGVVPKSAEKRLAVACGLVEPQDGFKSAAMILGDEVEMTVYEQLKKNDERWESNKLLTSKKYSKDKLKLIAHVDFFLQDDENKTIKIVECKATKNSTMETEHDYKNQLFVEFMLGTEYASTLDGRWKVQLSLCHYCTAEHDGTFNPDFLTFKRVIFRAMPFDINKGMEILNAYASTMDGYFPDDEVDADYLPEQVKEKFDMMANILTEIKERERKVEEFKEQLYEFLVSHNIKSIKNDTFSITRVDPTESVSFDHKSFLADYAAKHPRKYKNLVKKFEKRTNRKGYAKVTVKQ